VPVVVVVPLLFIVPELVAGGWVWYVPELVPVLVPLFIVPVVVVPVVPAPVEFVVCAVALRVIPAASIIPRIITFFIVEICLRISVLLSSNNVCQNHMFFFYRFYRESISARMCMVLPVIRSAVAVIVVSVSYLSSVFDYPISKKSSGDESPLLSSKVNY